MSELKLTWHGGHGGTAIAVPANKKILGDLAEEIRKFEASVLSEAPYLAHYFSQVREYALQPRELSVEAAAKGDQVETDFRAYAVALAGHLSISAAYLRKMQSIAGGVEAAVDVHRRHVKELRERAAKIS
jgi:hypothetical protein